MEYSAYRGTCQEECAEQKEKGCVLRDDGLVPCTRRHKKTAVDFSTTVQ